MSFIYAEKTVIKFDDQNYPLLHIMGDTRFTPVPGVPNNKNWGKKTFEMLMRYGIVKSMIVGPKCCISFAGNNIAFAHKLLTFVYAGKSFTEDQLLTKALELHLSAKENEIEFLICCIDENNEASICCIKDGILKRNCPQAWIGSSTVHKALQSYRNFDTPKAEESFTSSQFRSAIEKSGDDSVGGYITEIRYDSERCSFVYSERLESHTGQDQIVQPGESIRLYDNATNGGYMVHYYESPQEFFFSIDQGDLTIVYSNLVKYTEPNSINSHTRYFMTPILMRTSTWSPIEEIKPVE